MNFRLGLLAFLILAAGCVRAQYTLAPAGTLPGNMPSWEIAKSPYLAELKRTYGTGIPHELAKIKYLLGHTRLSEFRFVRNGFEYDADTTADHLRKKYRQRADRIRTAQQFIDHVASISTESGLPYLVLPGDGLAYPTGDLLNYELRRLEAFMDEERRPIS